MPNLYLVLSCLQGRPMSDAFKALAKVGVGVQLTRGNHPTPDFEAYVQGSGVPTRTHQGFSWTQRFTPVWSADGALLASSHSVHPPQHTQAEAFWANIEANGCAAVLEVMYPGYCLGQGTEVERVLDLGLALAVDISHLYLQREAGVLSEATLARVLASPNIAEVHVSANEGRYDSHHLISPTTWGLAWARERAASGTPIILESYFHGLPASYSHAQAALLQ